jgi:CheY-like chemotaxis protein
MPIMDGLRMVEKILELEPEMKTLFMTGYSDAQLEVLARTRFPLIRKPFLPPHLERGDPQEQLTRLEAAPGALTAPKTQ